MLPGMTKNRVCHEHDLWVPDSCHKYSGPLRECANEGIVSSLGLHQDPRHQPSPGTLARRTTPRMASCLGDTATGRLTWIKWLCWTVNNGDPVPVNLAPLEVGTGSPCMGLCKTWERELVPDLGSGAETLGALRNCALLLTIRHVTRHQTEMQKCFKPSVGEEPYAFPCFE